MDFKKKIPASGRSPVCISCEKKKRIGFFWIIRQNYFTNLVSYDSQAFQKSKMIKIVKCSFFYTQWGWYQRCQWWRLEVVQAGCIQSCQTVEKRVKKFGRNLRVISSLRSSLQTHLFAEKKKFKKVVGKRNL